MASDGLIKACQIEARRCRAAIAKGSPVEFWRRRLKGLLDKLDSARRIVQLCIDELPGGAGTQIQQIQDSLRQPVVGAKERVSEPWRYAEEDALTKTPKAARKR